MTFFSIFFALLIEQIRPLRADNPVYRWVKHFASRVEASFNAGQARQGRVGWFCVILALTLPSLFIYWLLLHIGAWAALLWNIFILYLTLGFRHYSHYFSSIQLALNTGDEAHARILLAEWTKLDTTAMDVSELSRVAVEKALITTHRHVFGVFFWFLVPLGPACAIMYRVAEYLARGWNESDHMRNEAFGRFAEQAFYWIDWIPARLTAAAFAVVGNFEDAIYAWRNFSSRWKNETDGIILSTGGGAMGILLGTPAQNAAAILPLDAATIDPGMAESETPPGELPTPRALQSTVGLVWRALLLWMFLLLLLSVAIWVG